MLGCLYFFRTSHLMHAKVTNTPTRPHQNTNVWLWESKQPHTRSFTTFSPPLSAFFSLWTLMLLCIFSTLRAWPLSQGSNAAMQFINCHSLLTMKPVISWIFHGMRERQESHCACVEKGAPLVRLLFAIFCCHLFLFCKHWFKILN